MHGTNDLLVLERVKSREVLTGIYCIEEIRSLLLLFNVGINQERVRFGVNVLHHDLETIEASSLWNLYLAAETFDQILIDNSIRGGEKG